MNEKLLMLIKRFTYILFTLFNASLFIHHNGTFEFGLWYHCLVIDAISSERTVLSIMLEGLIILIIISRVVHVRVLDMLFVSKAIFGNGAKAFVHAVTSYLCRLWVIALHNSWLTLWLFLLVWRHIIRLRKWSNSIYAAAVRANSRRIVIWRLNSRSGVLLSSKHLLYFTSRFCVLFASGGWEDIFKTGRQLAT